MRALQELAVWTYQPRHVCPSIRLHLNIREVPNDNFHFRLQSHKISFTLLVTNRQQLRKYLSTRKIFRVWAAQTDENRYCVHITVFGLHRQIETGTVCLSQCLGCTDR